jgi:dihydroorotase
MIGLESCFGAVNKVLVKENDMDQLSLIQMLTTKPRAIMGFNNKLFDIGVNAELTIIDLKEEWVFSRKDIQSRSHNSPFIGQNMYGRIKYTINKGHISVI